MNKETFRKHLSDLKVTPVAVFNDPEEAVKTSEILLKHDIALIEITLRTEKSLSCIERVTREFPEMITGAGSVFTSSDLEKAIGCGASFAVSPVFSKELGDSILKSDIPWIPGAATATEIYTAMEYSEIVKVFPAKSLGGPGYIKSMTAPFKMKSLSIVPTGGVTIDNVRDFLELDIVINCGMSWIVDPSLILKGNWTEIEERIKKVRDLPG